MRKADHRIRRINLEGFLVIFDTRNQQVISLKQENVGFWQVFLVFCWFVVIFLAARLILKVEDLNILYIKLLNKLDEISYTIINLD